MAEHSLQDAHLHEVNGSSTSVPPLSMSLVQSHGDPPPARKPSQNPRPHQACVQYRLNGRPPSRPRLVVPGRWSDLLIDPVPPFVFPGTQQIVQTECPALSTFTIFQWPWSKRAHPLLNVPLWPYVTITAHPELDELPHAGVMFVFMFMQFMRSIRTVILTLPPLWAACPLSVSC